MTKVIICGINVYDKLPENSKPATIDDFHINGKRKIGMKFYIKNRAGKYEEYTVIENTTRNGLLTYVKYELVYVIDANDTNNTNDTNKKSHKKVLC